MSLMALAGCAHSKFTVKTMDPKALVNQICSQRDVARSIKGSVWMKVKSNDASGQFPADVVADGDGKLSLEVTNLLGGTEAIITVEGSQYRIQVPNKPERKEVGYGYWGGIPLRWASDVFMGYIPCPMAKNLPDAQFQFGKDEDLVVQTIASLDSEPERFTYRFRSWWGKPWVDSVKWERLGALKLTVEFKFDEPHADTGIPQKWEAKSVQGEVKVRWKERDSISKRP